MANKIKGYKGYRHPCRGAFSDFEKKKSSFIKKRIQKLNRHLILGNLRETKKNSKKEKATRFTKSKKSLEIILRMGKVLDTP